VGLVLGPQHSSWSKRCFHAMDALTTRQDPADVELLLHLPLPLTTLPSKALLALFVVYTSITTTAGAYILLWMLYFPKHERPDESQDVQRVFAMLTSRTLEVASHLQHVDSAAGEKCALCHEEEPIAPVRISCQHLFCCGCAHAVFARHVMCPLCFKLPLPQQKTVPVPESSLLG
jgi:hypothetical protein